MTQPLSLSDKRLRASVLIAVAVEFAFIVFLTIFLFKHADPKGDGMESVGASAAFMLIFLPFSLPLSSSPRTDGFSCLRLFSRESPPSSISRLLARNSRRARHPGRAWAG